MTSLGQLTMPGERYVNGQIELRRGDWREVLGDVECNALVTDPPYSERTHAGHDDAANMANDTWRWTRSDGKKDRRRRSIDYAWLDADGVREIADAWAPRVRGWTVVLSDSELTRDWRDAFEAHKRTAFQPLACLIPGMTVRLCGDGPSSWTIYANVSRPKALSDWGTLPGGYYGGQGERVHIGGKPLWLMRALIRDYTKPEDIVVDPFAGAATTLIAAALEGRRAIGCEIDPATYAIAKKRIESTPILPIRYVPEPEQLAFVGDK